MVKNKKGWIKIAEAFLAILLLMGIILVIVNQNYSKDIKSSIETRTEEILRGIQATPEFRKQILEISQLPLNSSDASFPEDIKNYTQQNSPAVTTCFLKICTTTSDCLFEEMEKEVYSFESLILSNNQTYAPRKIRIFCYPNGI
jgi:acyl-CoA synthetase (AMP-forming)/AMP-acid ligase II